MLLLEISFFFVAAMCLLQAGVAENFINKWFLVVFFLLFSSIAAFRISSPDYINYHNYFLYLSNGGDYTELNIVASDPAFAYLNYFLSYFSSDSILIFSFFAFISVYINFSCFKKYSRYYFLCIIFYVSHTYVAREMMQIRAGLACAICLFSIRYIVYGNFKRFFIVVIIASSFHLGAAVFFLAYSIGRINISREYIFVLIIATLIIGVLFPLGSLFKSLPEIPLLSRIQYYNDTEYSESIGVFSNIVVIKTLLVLLLSLFFYNKIMLKTDYFKVSFNLYLFSLIWLVLWNDFSIVAARIATYFSITEVLLLSYFPLIVKGNIHKVVVTFFLIIFAVIIMFLNIYMGKWDDVILPDFIGVL